MNCSFPLPLFSVIKVDIGSHSYLDSAKDNSNRTLCFSVAVSRFSYITETVWPCDQKPDQLDFSKPSECFSVA